MKKFLFMLLAILSFSVFACIMEEKMANEFKQILSENGYTDSEAERIINELNDLRISLAVEGMSLEEIDKLTRKIFNSNYVKNNKSDSISVINRVSRSISAAQKNATNSGFGSLKVESVTDSKNGINIVLKKESGNNSQIIQISATTNSTKYSTTGISTTNKDAIEKKQQLKEMYEIKDDFVPYKNTSSASLNGVNIRFIPSKKVKSNGAGNVVVKDGLITEK